MKTRPCVRCGTTIPEERIQALPKTRVCVQCSEAVGGEFKTYTKRVSLGKTGSLKKNYGDYDVVRVRKRIEPLS